MGGGGGCVRMLENMCGVTVLSENISVQHYARIYERNITDDKGFCLCDKDTFMHAAHDDEASPPFQQRPHGVGLLLLPLLVLVVLLSLRSYRKVSNIFVEFRCAEEFRAREFNLRVVD